MNIQKNRYLQLDGTPVESGEWRRYVSPLTLAAAFTGALIAIALPEEKTKTPPIVPILGAAIGVASQGYIRFRMMQIFNKARLQGYVIDTLPESKNHACSNMQLNTIIYESKLSANIGILVNVGFSIWTFSTKPFYEALAIELPYTPAPLAHSFEGYTLANKLNKKEWIVIGRGEMATQKERSTVQTPAMALVRN